MPTLVTAILAMIAQAPTAIVEITALYNAVKGALTTNDQEMIDEALAAAQASDARATARADAALDAASKR